MYRVVYEKRIASDTCIETKRCIEVVPAHELNFTESKLRGSVVKILNLTVLKIKVHQPNNTKRRYLRPQFERLREQLYKHFRRSKSRLFVRLLIDDFIADLEWNDLCKQAGFKPRSFADLWYKFKHRFSKELWWSPNTKNMMGRLECQCWVKEHMGDMKPSRTAMLEASTST